MDYFFREWKDTTKLMFNLKNTILVVYNFWERKTNIQSVPCRILEIIYIIRTKQEKPDQFMKNTFK